MQTTEEVIAITDPGEVNRAEQNKGDRFIVFVGNIGAWLFPALMVAICAQVVLRNSGLNQAWLDDLQWWIYGAAVLIGVAYAVTTDSHVRVDVLYDNYPREKQTRITLFAIGWLFLPFIILAWDVTVSYAITSVVADEGSSSPNGLHNLFLLKTMLPILFITAAIGAWSVMYRNLKKIAEPTLVRQLLWAFPATLMLMERIVHYAAYWVIRFASPDIPWRRVSREPFFDYTTFVSLALIALVIAIAWLIGNKQKAGR